MKCSDCGSVFEQGKEERRMKVELGNPGVVFFNAKTVKCPDCEQHVIHEEDIDEAIESFEKEHKKMHGS